MPLTEQERVKLEIELARGDDYQRVYETYLKPFFEQKEKELFEAFKQMPTTEEEGLRILKLQCNALESLEDEFKTIIETGKLAQQTLREEDEDG